MSERLLEKILSMKMADVAVTRVGLHMEGNMENEYMRCNNCFTLTFCSDFNMSRIQSPIRYTLHLFTVTLLLL